MKEVFPIVSVDSAEIASAFLERGKRAVLLRRAGAAIANCHGLEIRVEELAASGMRSDREAVIAWGLAETPFGQCLLAEARGCICALRFVGLKGFAHEWSVLQSHWRAAEFVRDDARAEILSRRIFAKISGGKISASNGLTVLLSGTDFQRAVWKALLQIPDRCAVSYEQVARAVGKPRAVRAVGSAVGSNPIAYLVPCHRVLRKSGELGGYLYGLECKRQMLAREAAVGGA